ncbi:MAG: hypothetical protein EOM23_01060, partial [Candidatus Moranbacteria bacterium]|nr:hypothetical protein [Candidatus Moranbacteria bacterium]
MDQKHLIRLQFVLLQIQRGSFLAILLLFWVGDILAFLHYGPWIRKVTIPKDAKVYENPGILKKWKADRVILGRKYKITAKVIQRLIKEGADPKADD